MVSIRKRGTDYQGGCPRKGEGTTRGEAHGTRGEINGMKDEGGKEMEYKEKEVAKYISSREKKKRGEIDFSKGVSIC